MALRTAPALIACLLLAGSPQAKPAPVSIVVEHGPYLPSGSVVRLRVTVEPNPANREMWVAIEASGYATAHFEQLDGAPKTRVVEFKGCPDGDYAAYARVIREHGETSVSAEFSIGAVEQEEQFP